MKNSMFCAAIAAGSLVLSACTDTKSVRRDFENRTPASAPSTRLKPSNIRKSPVSTSRSGFRRKTLKSPSFTPT